MDVEKSYVDLPIYTFVHLFERQVGY